MTCDYGQKVVSSSPWGQQKCQQPLGSIFLGRGRRPSHHATCARTMPLGVVSRAVTASLYRGWGLFPRQSLASKRFPRGLLPWQWLAGGGCYPTVMFRQQPTRGRGTVSGRPGAATVGSCCVTRSLGLGDGSTRCQAWEGCPYFCPVTATSCSTTRLICTNVL